MAKNIELMGAVFPDVPSIKLQQYGGGLANFDDTSDGDITASDVTQGKIGYAQGQKVIGTAVAPTGSRTFTENGTFDVTSIAEAVINVAGGGGASNFVSGEFTTGTTEGKQTINIPYTGNGYPLVAMIYVKNPEGEWKTFVGQNAIAQSIMVKNFPDIEPAYNGSADKDKSSCTSAYKSSATSSTAHKAVHNSAINMFNDSFSAASSSVNRAYFSSANQLNVYVRGTSYGFAQDMTYGYCIIYTT